MALRFVSSVLALLFVAICGANAVEPTLIGREIDDFQLRDYLGTMHSLHDWHDKKAVVVAFLGTECPLAKLYAPRLQELASQYEAKGVQFVAIDSNQQDSLAKIAKFASDSKIEFPLLKDPGNKVADQFGATRVSEVFLLDDRRAVRYHGAVDDQYTVGVARPEAHTRYLAAALDQLLAGQAIGATSTAASGCFIGRVNPKPPTGEITYTKQISRILNEHCVECHRPGQVAPFALTSYDETIGWVDAIREVIQTERMPPWHADPRFGKFHNDARMAEDDKKLIYQWIENGVPRGDPADLPGPPKFDPDWRISKPDLVVRMPKPFAVPAKGVVPYQYFTVDPFGFAARKAGRGIARSSIT
jgi:peroxiredoxin